MIKTLRFSLLSMLMMLCGTMWAEDVSWKLTFPNYNDKSISSYTEDWTATVDGNIWSISGFNNNKNEWNFIRCGRKGNAHTASITSPETSFAATNITYTVDKTSNVESVSFEVINGSTSVSTTDITEKFVAGEVSIDIANGQAGDCYKLTINSTSASGNGTTQISKIVLTGSMSDDAPVKTAKPVIEPRGGNFFESIEVTLNHEDEEASIFYTLNSEDWNTAVEAEPGTKVTLRETTVLRAKAFDYENEWSDVVTYTFTKQELSTLAQAQAAEKGTTVAVEGTVVASAANGAVLSDGTDYLYYYNTSNALTVGQKVRMVGALSTYGGANQLSSDAAVTVLGEETVTHPAAVELTGAEMDEIQTAEVAERKYVSFTGTLDISRNYFNITVDGAETAVASIVKPNEDLSELNGMNVKVTGYLMYVNGKYVYAVATNVARVSNELMNANFTANEIVAQGVRTYDKDKKEGDVAQQQEITGWTIAGENGDARATGIFAYGDIQFLGSPGDIAPVCGPASETVGKALGIVAVWSAAAQYTQTLTLEAGTYTLEAAIYNEAGTGEIANNLFGIDDTYATTKKYEVGKWTIEKVTATLEEAKEVTISLGYKMTNSGSAAAPHLFVDHVKLFKNDDADAIAAIESAAEAANAIIAEASELQASKKAALASIDNFIIGEGFFAYTKAAIDAAKAAIKNAETTTAVEEALAAAKAAQTKPAADKEYVITNKTANLALKIADAAVKIAEEGIVKFTEVEGGWVLSNNAETPEYIFKTNSDPKNTWSFSTTTNIDEAYKVNFNLVDGAYTIQGANGLFGTDNTTDGSAVYANKAQSNNGLWLIAEAEGQEEVPTSFDVTFDFNASNHAVSATGLTDGDITENEVITVDGVTMTISPAAEDVRTANRYWSTNNGPQLRMYSGTMTITAPDGKAITKATFNNGKWNTENTFNGVAAETGEWEGNSASLILTVAGNTQINSVVLTISNANEETTTGIVAVKADNHMEGIFNLNGQKVMKAQKGLYIINGKKVVLK